MLTTKSLLRIATPPNFFQPLQILKRLRLDFDCDTAVGLADRDRSERGLGAQYCELRIIRNVKQEFVAGIVGYATSAHKARTENCIPTLAQHLPVADDISAIVGFISYHYHYGVPGYVIESICNGAPKAVVAEISDWPTFWDAGMDLLEQTPSGVRAAIVHDHDSVANLLQAQFKMEVFNGGADTAFFVLGRNHHGE